MASTVVNSVAQRSTPGGKVYVILVNWNNWADTLECLESVLRSDYPRFQVIVCDNGSTDHSIQRLKAWAEGRLEVVLGDESPAQRTPAASLRKPIPYLELDARTCAGEAQGEEGHSPLVLISSGTNLGFAGGNNLALKYVLARDDAQYVWLLNNDTVVAPDALTELVRMLEVKPGAGQCGSTILFYHRPDTVQVCGGCRYNSWSGRIRPIGAGRLVSDLPDTESVEGNMDYVDGASLLARTGFVKQVGLLTEEYFLYFEEIDWATRAKGCFSLAYAPYSRVYHKEGRTAGSSSDPRRRTTLADLHLIRSRILYTRKFRPWAVPTVCLGVVVMIVNRIRRDQGTRVLPMLRVAAQALVEKLGSQVPPLSSMGETKV